MRRLLASAAKAAYSSYPRLPGYMVRAFFGESTEAFVFYNDKDVIIAFRGTDSMEDWSLDARFWRTHVAGLPGTWHRGFVRALEPVYRPIESWLAFHPLGDRKLFVTGHSLGGALAVLCAAELHKAGLSPNGVLTLGAPRCMSVVAAGHVKDWFECIRYEHVTDRIPHLPYAAFGYRHIGERVRIGMKPRRWWARLPAILTFPVRAKLSHGINRYLRYVTDPG